MKKTIILLFALCLSFTLSAQPPMGGGFPGGRGGFPGGFPGGMMRMGMPGMDNMDADETAKMRTDLLDQVVGLDEKQYKKIYKLHKGIVEDLELQGLSTSMPAFPMMRGGRGGFPGGMRGGFPGAFGGGNNEEDEEQSEYEKAVEARNQKIRDNLDKKMIKTYKKVLTAEQYAKWEANEKEKEESARQLLERFQNGEMPQMPEGMRRPEGMPQMPEGFPPRQQQMQTPPPPTR